VKQPLQSPPSASPAGVRWRVAEPLPPVESGYPLGRTNVYVESPGQEVADRITGYLKLESIASFPSDEEKATLNAETTSCVKLAIRLFEDRKMTVVEVLRTAGCGVAFSRTARGVCRSAKGLEASAPGSGGASVSSGKRRLPLPSCIPREAPGETKRRVAGGLKVAAEMILSGRADLQLLGLESLRQIAAAHPADSNKILQEEHRECVESVVSLIVSRRNSALMSECEERNFITLRRAAVEALSECLNGKDRAPASFSPPDPEALVGALVGFLDASAESPHEAVFAARCLHSLHVLDEVRDAFADLDVADSVEAACSSGPHLTLLLETELRRLRSRLLGE